ncbi:MAG TPA: GNAT family N-acetyltransferase [Gaiellaceae bacterium]|nr:GNAT family N-acetyltransferase [Gaiellaceae bacterium]
MDVERFTDQYEVTAALHGCTPEDLRRRDRDRALPLRRWLAFRGGDAVGAVTAWLRPDDRMFLDFACRNPAAYGPLTEAAAEALRCRLHTLVDAAAGDAVAALEAAGFETELVQERFRIRFDRALALVDRAWVPRGFGVRRADEVEEERLFALDNALRRDTPGTDGWQGDRRWFHDELAEAPPFDPRAYLVAIDEGGGEYVGLARIWRNPAGPRFGLLGVLRRYRSTSIAAALLKQALTAASRWGHPTFTTETSPVNRVVYPRMQRLGAESLGRSLQLVRRG